MAKGSNDDNLKAEDGNRKTGFSDNCDRMTEMTLDQDAFWDDDDDSEAFGDDYKLAPEEEETFNRIIRNALESEIEYYTGKGKAQGASVFSERYENNLKTTLENILGEAEAAEILKKREKARQEKAEEYTRYYEKKLEVVSESKHTLLRKMRMMWRACCGWRN